MQSACHVDKSNNPNSFAGIVVSKEWSDMCVLRECLGKCVKWLGMCSCLRCGHGVRGLGSLVCVCILCKTQFNCAIREV